MPPLLLSVGIYSRFYPGSWIVIMGVLFQEWLKIPQGGEVEKKYSNEKMIALRFV